jgi:hypothetical protein
MEGTGMTLRHIFLQYLDKQGQSLLQPIEQTSTGGTYRFIFDKSTWIKSASGKNATRTTDTSRQIPLQ